MPDEELPRSQTLASQSTAIDFPYLLANEIAPVAKAFDNLFSTVETKETDKGIALLSPSLGRVDANKVDIAVARTVVSDLLSGWRNAPDSRVVATFDDIPTAVRKEITDQGEKTARGVFHGDTFYLIADEHASANEVEETVFHEVWAHYPCHASKSQSGCAVILPSVRHRITVAPCGG